jgi:hypothetical protein
MNRIILSLVVTLLITVNVSAQERWPTRKVKKAFHNQYENAEIIKWEYETSKNRVTLWKALFKRDDVLSSAWYDEKANWIQTKTKISEDELPEAVLKSIEENYYRYKIVLTARFQNPETDGFEVFLDNEDVGFNVQFSKEGEILSRTIRSEGYAPINDDGEELEE